MDPWLNACCKGSFPAGRQTYLLKWSHLKGFVEEDVNHVATRHIFGLTVCHRLPACHKNLKEYLDRDL